MEGNKITEWSYDLPTEPGLYLCCFGDVEVEGNCDAVNFIMLADGLIDLTGDSVNEYVSGCKWARLLIGSDAR